MIQGRMTHATIFRVYGLDQNVNISLFKSIGNFLIETFGPDRN